jgi:cytochrome P450
VVNRQLENPMAEPGPEASPSGWDWDPREASVQRDQVAAYDEMRERCPVAHSQFLGWSVLRHEDVVRVLDDHEHFSSRVSARRALPSGMDPPEHTAYRAVVDRCFSPELVASFEPQLREIAVNTVAAAVAGTDEVEVMSAIAQPFAAQALCAYLGWPIDAGTPLQVWAADSARATRTRDGAQLSRAAERFDRIIVEMLQQQRSAGPDGSDTVTGRLLAETVDGVPLTDAQMVSMLRNWTVGELGTIAAAVGIVAEFLARRPDIQHLLRSSPDLRESAIDEMLRLEAPLIANRRRTTGPVVLRGRMIPADEPVTILWPSAQRDPRVISEPTVFRLDRDPDRNLLYGRGPHACPGEGLARMQLGVLLEELLRLVPAFSRTPGTAPGRAAYPAGGFTDVRITWRGT